MSAVLEAESIDSKAQDLCQTILDDPQFASARARIDAFMEDTAAQEIYKTWQAKSQELHQMGSHGLQPNDDDLAEFERLKGAVMASPVASGFVEAENGLNTIFSSVTKRIQKTLQLGRLPEEEDLVESGCCGGGGGGGCGC